MPFSVGFEGGIPLIFSVIESIVALGGLILIYRTYRETNAAPLKGASIAFLTLAVASIGIALRRILYIGVEPPIYLYTTDFGYMFAAVLLYKAMSK